MSQQLLTAVNQIGQSSRQAFLTLNLITGACHGVANTVFVPPPNKPTWFDALSKKLDASKADANTWIEEIAPGVTGGVPKMVIDYSPTYAAMTESIEEVVRAHPDARGPDDPYVKEVHDLVQALREPVLDTVEEAKKTEARFKAWGEAMQASHDALSSGAANIQAAETELATEIKKMNSAIETLEGQIHAENKAVIAGAALVGGGVFLAVVGVALAPVSGGASLVVGGVGVAAIIGGAVTWGVMQHKIDQQFHEISEDQNQRGADEAQLVALKGISSATNQVLTYQQEALSALSELRTSWTVFDGELEGVANKLKGAEDGLSTIVEGAFTKAAAKEWTDATSLAQELFTVKPEVVTNVLPMQSNAKAA